MEYKVLIKLCVPEIEGVYEVYIPINKTIAEISHLLNQLVNELSEAYPTDKNIKLYNRRTGMLYDRELIIRNTDIRNGTELVLI